jgi:hypothetical protein
MAKKSSYIRVIADAIKERMSNPYDKRKRDYSASVAPDKYKGLNYSPRFEKDLSTNIEAIKAIVDGMSTPNDRFYNVVPDSSYGMDLTPVSDIHDYDYTYPMEFETEQDALSHKRLADLRFYNNMLKMVELKSTPESKASGLDERRRMAAKIAYRALQSKRSMKPFMRNTTIKKAAAGALPISQALKQLDTHTTYIPPKEAPGSKEEPVHVRFGKSHYGEHAQHGPHFATMVNGNNVHVAPDGNIFILTPEGKGIRIKANRRFAALYKKLGERTGYGMPKTAEDIQELDPKTGKPKLLEPAQDYITKQKDGTEYINFKPDIPTAAQAVAGIDPKKRQVIFNARNLQARAAGGLKNLEDVYAGTRAARTRYPNIKSTNPATAPGKDEQFTVNVTEDTKDNDYWRGLYRSSVDTIQGKLDSTGPYESWVLPYTEGDRGCAG